MKERIVVFDLEMLNRDPASICSIGIVEYINHKVNSTYYSLVKPANLSFDYHAFQVHGIRVRSLYHEKSFKNIWPEIKHYFEDSIIVSHDISGDISHLRNALKAAHIDYPSCIMSCTSVIAHINFKDEEKYNLEYLCKKYDYHFKAHNSLEDAKACGFLLFKMLEEQNCATLYDFHSKYKIPFGEMKKNYYKNLISPENIDRLDEYFDTRYFSHHTITVIGRISLSKVEFEEKTKQIHAFYTNHVSTQTNFVVLGKLEKKDSKQLQKVKELQSIGQDIQVISEDEFFKHYNEYVSFV